MDPNHTRSKRGARPDWSQLLPENLDIILQKLTDYADYFVFGEVCTSWRSVFLDRCPLVRPPPCMLLTAPDDTTTALPLMVLRGGKLRKLRTRVQLLPQESIVGSSMGWLVLGFLNEPGLHLMNPISGNRISLPSLTSSGVPLQLGRICQSIFHVEQIVVSSVPSSGDCLLAARGVSDTKYYSGFLWCRLGNREWTTFTLPVKIRVADIMFHNRKLYVLGDTGEIFVCAFEPKPKLISKGSIINNTRHFHSWRLVKSGSELWTVAQYEDWPQYPIMPPIIRNYVFKLGENGLWVRVKSLDDKVLLNGKSGAMSLCTKDLIGSGFKAGCMYQGTVDSQTFLPFLMKLAMTNNKSWMISIPDESRDKAEQRQEVEWTVPQEW